ncbi:MAG: hypothetical protein WCI73_02975 [Phycisphaerae bacterium]
MNQLELNSLNNRLREQAMEMGASHYGIADLTSFYTARPKSFEDYGELLTGVSIIVPENNVLLNGLPLTDDESRTSHYNIKIALSLQIAGRVREILMEHGFKAEVLKHPPTKSGPTGLLKGAARLAGLGWIGKNRLLITRDYGPRVCPTLVMTDAPFTPAAKEMIEPFLDSCGICTRCLQICPSQAFSYEAFDENNSLDGFDTGRCAAVRGIINPTGWSACSLCVQACPFGAGNKDRVPAFHDAFPFLEVIVSESPL